MVNRRLALPLRPGDRRHAQRLRLQRRPALAPRAARLAGRRVPRRRRPAQADPPADRAVGDLPPVEPARRPGAGRRRRQPAALAVHAPAAGGRGDPRRDPGRRRHARPPDGRAGLRPLGAEHELRGRVHAPGPTSAPTPSAGWSTSSSRGASPTRPSAPSTAPTAASSPPGGTSRRRALQALNLLNSRFVLDQSGRLADRLRPRGRARPRGPGRPGLPPGLRPAADRRRAHRPPSPLDPRPRDAPRCAGPCSTPTSSSTSPDASERRPMPDSTPGPGGLQPPRPPPVPLAGFSTGLGGIALGALLAEHRLLGRRPGSIAGVPHHPAQGEAGRPDLLHRGREPPRHLGLQARAGQAPRPADAGRREARDLPGGERQPGPEPLGVPAAGRVGQDDVRTCSRAWASWPTRCASSTR